MSDFYQTGVIATLHCLGQTSLEHMEDELNHLSRLRKAALVLPCLYSELEGPALKSIVEQLTTVQYINEIVIALDDASTEEFQKAKRFFEPLGDKHKVLWNTGPEFSRLYDLLKKAELLNHENGKGRSSWMSFGYVLARGCSEVIVQHDCDIVTYNRLLLARLCYPLMHQNLDYEYCKGYYSRISGQMYGRVTRLFVTPILRALFKILGHHPLLVYLDSFRYPLSGEFSMMADLARINRIPSDWGLEVGLLSEIYRNSSVKRVCQIDISDEYEHKHKSINPESVTTGLMKMVCDIAKSLFRNLTTEGVVFSSGLFNTLFVTYKRTAQDHVRRYHDDAVINGLQFDLYAEAKAIDAFVSALREAANQFYNDPADVPLIPNWNCVLSAIPDFHERLIGAVERDNR